MSELTLSELFAAADSIADHRSPRDRSKYARRIRKAQAELGEAIGYPEVEQ